MGKDEFDSIINEFANDCSSKVGQGDETVIIIVFQSFILGYESEECSYEIIKHFLIIFEQKFPKPKFLKHQITGNLMVQKEVVEDKFEGMKD